jgi:hypothetical protein
MHPQPLTVLLVCLALRHARKTWEFDSRPSLYNAVVSAGAKLSQELPPIWLTQDKADYNNPKDE